MASGTSYGPYENRARVWFSWYQDPVVPSSVSNYMAINAYLQQDGSSSQFGVAGTTYWSGSWGTGNNPQTFTLNANDSVLIVTWSGSFTLTDAGQNVAFGAGAQHYFGYTSHALGLWVPPRYAVTPTGLTVTRVSDTQQNLAWTRNSTYSSVIIQRQTDDGPWVTIATPTGNLAAWSDTTTQANRKYAYRVAGVGGSGQSAGWTNVITIYTTPAPVASIVATRVGNDIQLAVTGLPPWATSYDIYDNGSLVSPSGVDVLTFPWTHTAPNPAVAHTYTIKSKRGALVSAFSDPSNTVQLQAPPNAPTNLVPNGTTIVAGEATAFSWTHNPVDSSPQSAYELRYRPVGSGVWTTVSGTTASTRNLTLTPDNYEWQVRTKGADPGWSPWSALATTQVINRPGTAITQPSGSTWNLPAMQVQWTYFQAQSLPQSGWQVRLLDASNAIIEDTGQQTGAVLSYTLLTRLLDGENYTVQVRTASGGIWSDWMQQTFEVDFIEPLAPEVDVEWDESSGSMTLTMCPAEDPDPDPDVPLVETAIVERSLDEGLSWEFAGSFDLSEGCQSFSDFESRSCGTTLYRVTGYASTGASAVTEITGEAHSQALWIGGGIGFSQTARLPGDPAVKYTRGRRRSVEEYEGRTFPVAYSSARLLQGVAFSGRLADGEPDWADHDDLAKVVELIQPVHCYRDMHGERMYGSLSLLDLTKVGQRRDDCTDSCPHGIWSYSLTLTRTDRD